MTSTQKADGGAAIVGFVADESGQIGMVLRQVHGGAQATGVRSPPARGTTDLGSISGDAGMGWGPTEVEELTGQRRGGGRAWRFRGCPA